MYVDHLLMLTTFSGTVGGQVRQVSLYYISFVIWWGLCNHHEGSLSRRTGPDPWSFEEMCLQLGQARSFGTTALSNYEVRVVARLEGGFLGVSMQAVARGLKRIMKSERLPRGIMSVQEAAEKRRVARRVHLAQDYAVRNLIYALGMN